MVRWALRNGWRPEGAGDGIELAAAARSGDPCAAEAFARGGRVLGAMVAAAAATCDISRVVVAGRSEVLDVGRATPTATPAQWKALVIRDQHCQHPGCERPPSHCQAVSPSTR